jgi:signal transduction histidine kinase
MLPETDDAKAITEGLYKQNLELAVKNKTLSLLRQLYQISILALEQEPLAEKIVEIVRTTLTLELVSIFLLDSEHENFVLLRASRSERLAQVLADTSQHLAKDRLPGRHMPFFAPIFELQPNHTENIHEVWKGQIPDEALKEIVKEGHVKALAAYPLVIDGALMGVLLLGINREFEKLNQYEREAIASLVEVTAVALDRARLYQELKVANEKLATANDRLKELDQLKSEFLSIASHQLRAPLTAIRGYASLVLQGDYGVLPENLKEPLARVAESARVMASSIDDYLNISRIEQGRLKFEMAPVALGDLARKVVDELQPVAKQRHLALNFTPPAEEVTVSADVGKIKQVISNLVDNAIKYTEQGSVSIVVEKHGSGARITVSDTGIGIAKEEIGALFEKFTRARGANKVNTTGTGLGLYVAKQLVEGHKGKIWIESDGLGKGTRFIVELPG